MSRVAEVDRRIIFLRGALESAGIEGSHYNGVLDTRLLRSYELFDDGGV